MSANKQGIHHVAMKAADFDATVKFYTEGLGFVRKFGWGEGAEQAALLDSGNGNYLEVFAGGQLNPPDGNYMHVAFRSDDVDTDFARALNAGAVPTIEPKDVPIEGDKLLTFRIAFCKGLNGEVIEFFQNDEL